MKDNCLFCKIIAKEIPSDIIYEDDDILAFKDIEPQAPLHILIIPKAHIPTLNATCKEDDMVLGKMQRIAAYIAAKQNLAEDGFRTVINCNKAGGQVIYHIHLHLLAGRDMQWPPG